MPPTKATEPVTAQVEVAPDANTKEQYQNQISSAARDVSDCTGEVERVSEKITEAREKLPEYDRVADLEGQLEVARKALSQAEASNQAMNDLKDEGAAVRRELREAQWALSGLLVKFLATYQQRSVMVDFAQREIDVSAKLGKALDRQEALPL